MTDYPLTWLADVLRAEGCRVIEESGWKSRGRPASSGSFHPRALLRHWDASSKGSHGAISTVLNGTGDTPGPLCSILTCRGNDSHGPSVHVIAAGRTNHGGTGDAWGVIPRDDANTYAVGHEIAHTSNEPWDDAQMTQVRKAEAAILRRLNAKTSNALPCHAEYAPGRKVDTNTGSHAQDMKSERSKVQSIIDGGDDMGDLTLVSSPAAETVKAGAERYVTWETVSRDPLECFGTAALYLPRDVSFEATVYLKIDEPCRLRLARWQKDPSGEIVMKGTFGITEAGPGYASLSAAGELDQHDYLRVSVLALDTNVAISGGRWTTRTWDR